MRDDALLDLFERERPRLRSVAYRILGSTMDADDVLQETWLRMQRVDATTIAQPSAWLTSVVGRVALDQLRARSSRREDVLDVDDLVPAQGDDPEEQAVLSETFGVALLAVMDSLSPTERVALVLHDMCDVPFEEVAQAIGRSPAATRQLARRARIRTRDRIARVQADLDARRAIVDAFLTASRQGDLAGLLAILDPDAVVVADPAAIAMGSAPIVAGADAVAATFRGRAEAARAAWIGVEPGAVWMYQRLPRVVFRFTIVGERITRIDLVADEAERDRLAPAIILPGRRV